MSVLSFSLLPAIMDFSYFNDELCSLVTLVTALACQSLAINVFFSPLFTHCYRLGPSLWGATGHSEQSGKQKEVLLMLFGNFSTCDLSLVRYN